MNIKSIKDKIITESYVCDKCGKKGKHSEMRLIIGKGLFHAKCKKKSYGIIRTKWDTFRVTWPK